QASTAVAWASQSNSRAVLIRTPRTAAAPGSKSRRLWGDILTTLRTEPVGSGPRARLPERGSETTYGRLSSASGSAETVRPGRVGTGGGGRLVEAVGTVGGRRRAP